MKVGRGIIEDGQINRLQISRLQIKDGRWQITDYRLTLTRVHLTAKGRRKQRTGAGLRSACWSELLPFSLTPQKVLCVLYV